LFENVITVVFWNVNIKIIFFLFFKKILILTHQKKKNIANKILKFLEMQTMPKNAEKWTGMEQGDLKDDGLYTIYVVKRINGNLLL